MPPDPDPVPKPVDPPLLPEEDFPPPKGIFLIDAQNRLNKLLCKAMLWTVWHLWLDGACFVTVCYRH